jgi:hypothetical protein
MRVKEEDESSTWVGALLLQQKQFHSSSDQTFTHVFIFISDFHIKLIRLAKEFIRQVAGSR